MLRKHIIISEDLAEAVREFRFRNKYDTELAAFRVLIATGLRAYREADRDLSRRITGAVQGDQGAAEPAEARHESSV